MRRVAITGAGGYVGSVIAAGLPADATPIRLLRNPRLPLDVGWSLDSSEENTGRIFSETGATDLIHVAWDMQESAFSRVVDSCVTGSEVLLRSAKRAGVDRIIFISTISAFDGARSAYGRAKRMVEISYAEAGAVTFRLGLVHGYSDGGLLGAIRSSIRRSSILPLIGFGRGPQYLLSEPDLQHAIGEALSGRLDGMTAPITLADPKPVRFVDLVHAIARQEDRSVSLLPIPWPLLYAGLAGLERIGLRPPMRSDSVLSFVNPNPEPDFSIAQRLGLARDTGRF